MTLTILITTSVLVDMKQYHDDVSSVIPHFPLMVTTTYLSVIPPLSSDGHNNDDEVTESPNRITLSFNNTFNFYL